MTNNLFLKVSDIPSVLKIITQPNFYRWEPHEVLAEGLMLQTEVGDIQTAVCILIALGEQRNDLPMDEFLHVSTHNLA